MSTPVRLSQRRAFELELERVRLRAMAAIERVHGKPEPSALLSEIASVERRLRESWTSTDRDLAELLQLSPDERELMWCVVAATVDPMLAAHLDVLGHRDGRAGASVAQVALIADLEPARARDLALRVSRGGAGVRQKLLQPTSTALATTITGHVAVPRLLSFLTGEDTIDPALAGAAKLVELPSVLVMERQYNDLIERISDLMMAAEPLAIVLEGPAGSGRRTLTRMAAQRPVVALDLLHLPSHEGTSEALAALERESVLSRAIPAITGVHELARHGADVHRLGALARFVDSHAGVVFLISDGPAPHLQLSRSVVRLEVGLPTTATRLELWKAEIGEVDADADQHLKVAAMRYLLTPGQIRSAATTARARVSEGPALAISDGVRSTIQERLGRLAKRKTNKLDWHDLVISLDTREQIDILISRARHAYKVLEQWGLGRHLPGTGLAALFSGPPGTGKTVVAGLIAKALDLDLYRVDLSQVVSKWIGESEKQPRRGLHGR